MERSQVGGKQATIADTRAVLATGGVYSVVDIESGRHLRLFVPPPRETDFAVAMHKDQVILANRERIGIYSIAG